MIATSTSPADVPFWHRPSTVIVAGCLIALIGFGVRSSFGLFLDPMTETHGWGRGDFGLAMAIQNLLWGLGVPLAGALADRYGPGRVLMLGAVVYTAGVYGMATATTPGMLHLTGGVLTGLGVAFTAFSIAIAAMAKVVGGNRRSLVLGLGTAAGSAGQVLYTPIGQAFIEIFGWQSALFILAGTALVIIPLAILLPSGAGGGTKAENELTLGAAIKEAASHRGYVLLTVGFFVCGFHVAFITVHFPAYISDLGLGTQVGGWALSIIGLCNIVGSFGSGLFGQRWSKKRGLAGIYFLRAIVITALLMAPKTEATILIFSAAMGLLWLSTVPLTTGIVGQVFGIRYLATLFGFVFLSHQLGSFCGVALGGYLYDSYGSYDVVWWAGVALGLAAAIIHLPIDEKPLARLKAATA